MTDSDRLEALRRLFDRFSHWQQDETGSPYMVVDDALFYEREFPYLIVELLRRERGSSES